MKKPLGARIRELRQAARMSLRDLGDKLKEPGNPNPVSAAYLSDLENGRRFPSDEMFGKLAAALDTTEDELRSHDQRAAGRDLEDLVEMNPQYAFAFRQMIDDVKESGIPPEEVATAFKRKRGNIDEEED